MNIKKKINFIIIISAIVLLHANAFAQTSKKQNEIWQKVSQESLNLAEREQPLPEKYLAYRLNQTLFRKAVADAPLEFSGELRMMKTYIELPTPDGDFMRFSVEDSPILSTELAAEYPDWKTYQGFGVDDPTASVRFGINANGFHATIFSTRGTIVIDPYKLYAEDYITYYKKDSNVERKFHCQFDKNLNENRSSGQSFANPAAPQFTYGTQIRTYRIAINATGEYTQVFGNQTNALAAIVTTINRVTGIYRREFAVGFQLVSGTLTVYNNPATDPFTNQVDGSQLAASQSNLDALIGINSYDIGHLFVTAGSGLASSPVICQNGLKARGISGQANPQGDAFDVDYVAHEIGHQFGGSHTFNSPANCGLSNQPDRTEPGSGVTIIAYAGICSSTSNLQRSSIDQFHVSTQTRIVQELNGAGATCGQLSGTNNIPVVANIPNYTIPRDTPFTLTAAATDADNDALLYSWDENDAGTTPSVYPNDTDDDDTNMFNGRPMFRSYALTANTSRTFPSLTYILNNANEPPLTYTGTSATGAVCAATCITGEDLPSVARTMNFRVSVRDNKGGVADAGTVLTVVNTGAAFQVTAQNTGGSPNWQAGTMQTVTWNIAGTTANGINTANVKISLSTDGGQTFPIVLAATTPNDGTEMIAVPNNPTTQARIKVEAVGNVFFDINNVNFTITAPAQAQMPQLFIANGGDAVTPATFTVTTANLDGTNGQSLGNIGNFLNIPQGIAVNTVTNKLYVANEGGNSITMSNFDGTMPVNLTLGGLLNGPYGVALDVGGNRMFIANGGFNNNKIVRANLDGSNAVDLGTFNGLLSTPQGMDINVGGNKMYIANQNGTIVQANLDGTNAAALTFGGLLTGTTPLDVKVNVAGNRIYVADFMGKLFSADLNGNNAIDHGNLGGTLNAPRGIGLDLTGNKIYVSNSGNNTVTQADLPNITNPVVLNIATLNMPAVIAVFRPSGPTAASVSVAGRVSTPDGRGLSNALVLLTTADGEILTARTSSFGYFRLDDIEVGQTVTINVVSRRYQFNPQIITVNDNIVGLNLNALPYSADEK